MRVQVCALALLVLGGTAYGNDAARDLPTKVATETICGGSDDRELVVKPYVGRMLKNPEGSAPCSATLIGNSCMVSAGHCINYLKVAEFNTPVSEDRQIVHAAPEDQYEVDEATMAKSSPTHMGNDWAVYKVKANEITGLLPGEAQGQYMGVRYEPLDEGMGVEITGFGTAAGEDRNFSQQESFGDLRNVGSESDPTLKYHSDTTGGNSGSGVIDHENQLFIGVHTHGGCNQSRDSANSGTSLYFNPEFMQAVKDCLAGDNLDDGTTPSR